MGDLTPSAGRSGPDWVPLVVTVTLVQAVLALASRALPLFGMPLTRAGGVPPETVGQLSSATSLGSMIFFLWGPALLARLAPLRQLQLGCALAGAALLLSALGRWEALLVCAFLIGLGYGPSAPAGSDLLMRVVPRHRRATIFSIKQAGVPLGGLAAGLALPLVATLAGSITAGLTAAAALVFAAALALGRFRGLDGEPVADGPAPVPWRHLLLAPVRLSALVLGSPVLAGMTAAGFALGIAQGILMGFYPVFLSDHAGWSIVGAGMAFAVLQGVGVPGRVLMGWVSDRMRAPARALSILCLASGATMIAMTLIGPGSSPALVIALSAVAGLTVVSWNGVFLSGLAEAAPEGRVGEITAAGTFVLFTGYVVAPLAIQVVFTASDGYSGGFALAGVIPVAAGLALLAGPGRRSRRMPPP